MSFSNEKNEFKDNLFAHVNIPLYRIKVSSDYNTQLADLENKLSDIILYK